LIFVPPHSDADHLGLDVGERADVAVGVSRADEAARNALSLLRH